MIPGETAALALGWLLPAFAVTVAAEAVAAGLLGFRTPRELGVVVIANLATNPAVNLLVSGVMALTRTHTLAHPVVGAALITLEMLAVLVEWRIYHRMLPDQRRQALVVSVVANAASFAVGLIVFGVGSPGV